MGEAPVTSNTPSVREDATFHGDFQTAHWYSHEKVLEERVRELIAERDHLREVVDSLLRLQERT